MTKNDFHSIAIAKKAAGQVAANLIERDMLVGLGTGSTAAFFIEALGQRCREGLKIIAVATSKKSAQQAHLLGIPLKEADTVSSLDVTVDGADEIDHHKNMIKGGGGALLREKLLAQSSREMIVIIDETKWVEHIGAHPLPIEIASFVYPTTLRRLEAKGYQAKLRLEQNNKPYLTDNYNYIVDIQYSTPIINLPKEEECLKNIIGVLETGFFFHLAGRVIIGYKDGIVKIHT